MKFIRNITILLMCTSSLMKIGAAQNVNAQCLDGKCYINANSEKILKAVEHLNNAIQLVFTIENKEVQNAVFCQFKPCIDCLKKGYFSNNYDKVVQSATILHENLDEILSDCQEMQIREGITSCVNDMMDALSS
jgi:hypothetical protein